VAVKHDSGNARAEGCGRRSKRHVNAWPVPVLPRTHAQVDVIHLDNEMIIGWRHVYSATLKTHAVFRMYGGQRSRSAQDLRQEARGAWRHVDHDENGRGKIRRQVGY
jgi:hypothetical protein